MSEIQKDWLPVFTWTKFLYEQQKEFIRSTAWQTWFIAGNGAGKTQIVYLSAVLHMLGIHPHYLGDPPIKVRALVPSFDSVEDVALEKLLQPQRILFPKDDYGQPILTDEQREWIKFLGEKRALREKNDQYIEVGPMLPKSACIAKKSYTRDHRGIELRNGSAIWFATSEQGWQAARGGEQDILLIDEEGDERVTDEHVRGLRNAKGGGKIMAGLTPPYQPGQGPTWTKEKILEASHTDDSIHVINACMADNPAISSEFIKQFSKGKTTKQIAVQVYGQYPTWGDLVHPDFQDRMWEPKRAEGHLLPNDTELPESWEVDWVMAFDWHPSKPCAAVFGFVDGDGNVTIFDELDQEWAEGKEISELSDAFRSIEGHPHSRREFRRWQDPSAKATYNAIKRGFNAWDAFRRNGIVTAAGKNRDQLVGISIVNEYFRGNANEAPRVFIYERCKYLRRYLTNHYWVRKEDGVGKPDPKWSDYPICLRYILQELGWYQHQGWRKKSKWPLVSYQTNTPRRNTIDVSRLL